MIDKFLICVYLFTHCRSVTRSMIYVYMVLLSDCKHKFLLRQTQTRFISQTCMLQRLPPNLCLSRFPICLRVCLIGLGDEGDYYNLITVFFADFFNWSVGSMGRGLGVCYSEDRYIRTSQNSPALRVWSLLPTLPSPFNRLYA